MTVIWTRINTLLLVLVLFVMLALVGMLATGVRGGPLDPPGTPGPTMKTLQEVEPRTPISSIPYTITQPGSYYLTGNVANSSATHGITIQAPNVTLDLGGFLLAGSNIGLTGVRLGGSYRGVTVRNGSIEGWTLHGLDLDTAISGLVENVEVADNQGNGIRVSNVTLKNCSAKQHADSIGIEATSSTIINCRAGQNGVGFDVAGSTVTGCLAIGNTQIGIRASRSIVEECVANGNVQGIVADASQIYRNRTGHNGFDGIALIGDEGGSLVADNLLSYNGQAGATSALYVESNNNRVSHNHVNSTNGRGIQVLGSFNTIDENSALDNGRGAAPGGVGIYVLGSKNTVVLNSSLGNIEFGVTDNYFIGVGNNGVVETSAQSATSPWSNTE